MTIRIPRGEYAISTAVFDSSIQASAVVLEGEPGTLLTVESGGKGGGGAQGRRLSAPSGVQPLLQILSGAPPVYMRNMVLSGNLALEGGFADLHNCSFNGSPLGATVNAITVSGGHVVINDTTVRGFQGGGISVITGNVQLEGGALIGNGRAETATFGALMVGNGAVVNARNVRIEGNGYARDSCDDMVCVRGGGIKVVGGRVTLTGGTLLKGNRAFEGNTIYVDTSLVVDMAEAVSYQLPVPQGHYVIITDRGNTAPLSMAIVDDTYPFECSAGRYGAAADDEREAQSTPRCSGTCPRGRVCVAATVVPALCRNGTYCPRGSANELNCPAGTFGGRSGLFAESECEICKVGTQCPEGSAAETPCPPGSFAANTSSVACETWYA